MAWNRPSAGGDRDNVRASQRHCGLVVDAKTICAKVACLCEVRLEARRLGEKFVPAIWSERSVSKPLQQPFFIAETKEFSTGPYSRSTGKSGSFPRGAHLSI